MATITAPIALLVARRQQIPQTESEWEKTERHNWEYFLRMEGCDSEPAPRNLRHAQESLRIGEGVWQIPLDSGLNTLAQLAQWCTYCGVSYRILYFDEEPKWIGITKPIPNIR